MSSPVTEGTDDCGPVWAVNATRPSEARERAGAWPDSDPVWTGVEVAVALLFFTTAQGGRWAVFTSLESVESCGFLNVAACRCSFVGEGRSSMVADRSLFPVSGERRTTAARSMSPGGLRSRAAAAATWSSRGSLGGEREAVARTRSACARERERSTFFPRGCMRSSFRGGRLMEEGSQPFGARGRERSFVDGVDGTRESVFFGGFASVRGRDINGGTGTATCLRSVPGRERERSFLDFACGMR